MTIDDQQHDLPANDVGPDEQQATVRGRFLVRVLPVIVILCAGVTIVAPYIWTGMEGLIVFGGEDERRLASGQLAPQNWLAPLFTLEVDHWREDILRWAGEYNVDPNLVATIIQIESCGDPLALSVAGAQGLMQVMPQHFNASQNPLDPDTNARRGLDILTECLYSPYNPQQDVGLAFACYNGGPRVFVNGWEYWPQQSRDYYIWGTNIYRDAQNNLLSSETLDQWLLAGGQNLCFDARQRLGLGVTPVAPAF